MRSGSKKVERGGTIQNKSNKVLESYFIDCIDKTFHTITIT